MSANIDTMVYIGATPWHGLGVVLEEQPRSSQEIITAAKLDWTVAAAPMYTSVHQSVQNYHAIYREDGNKQVLGVVNKQYPRLVQNVDAFNAFNTLLGTDVEFETAASLGFGENVFGCFKIGAQYKVMDDDVDHYFVVLNDHLTADGKVTVLNTPVRVVCQNTLSSALNNNLVKYRVPCSQDVEVNKSLAINILKAADKSKENLNKRAEKLLGRKVTKADMEKVLDELFPYIKADEGSMHERANERTMMVRDTFLQQCMGADNLANYRGTDFQIFNALVDFEQHYFKTPEAGLDLEKRMKTIPGLATEALLSAKFLKVSDKRVA